MGSTSCGVATVTRPAPERSAPRAAKNRRAGFSQRAGDDQRVAVCSFICDRVAHQRQGAKLRRLDPVNFQMRIGFEQLRRRPDVLYDQHAAARRMRQDQLPHLGGGQRHGEIGGHDRPAEILRIGSEPGGHIDGHHGRLAAPLRPAPRSDLRSLRQAILRPARAARCRAARQQSSPLRRAPRAPIPTPLRSSSTYNSPRPCCQRFKLAAASPSTEPGFAKRKTTAARSKIFQQSRDHQAVAAVVSLPAQHQDFAARECPEIFRAEIRRWPFPHSPSIQCWECRTARW